jgi:hypothetical protein
MMTYFLNLLLIFATLFQVGTVFGQTVAPAAPLTAVFSVLVVTSDESRLAPNWAEDFVKKMELPAEIRNSLNISVVNANPKDANFRETLKSQIQDQASKGVVNALVLAIPAQTLVVRDGSLVTQFESVGSLSETSVDADFDGIFSDLKTKMSPQAQITMAGCVEFCGTDAQIQARAKSLLEYFKASSGAVTVFDLTDEKETKIELAATGSAVPPITSISYRRWIRAATFATVLAAFIDYNNSIWGIAIGAGIANWVSIKLPFLFDSLVLKFGWTAAKILMVKFKDSKVVFFARASSANAFGWLVDKVKSAFASHGVGLCESALL